MTSESHGTHDMIIETSAGQVSEEPAAWQHRLYYPDTDKWSEWRSGKFRHDLDNRCEERPLYAAPPVPVTVEALRKVREAILDPINNCSVIDTVWMPVPDGMVPIETLIDFIDAALAASIPQGEGDWSYRAWEMRKALGYAIKRVERDWHTPEGQDAARQMATELSELFDFWFPPSP